MWRDATHRKNKRLRKELAIAAAGGYAAATNVGGGQAHGELSAGRIVIVGWTGEPFLAAASGKSRNTIAAVAPVGAGAWPDDVPREGDVHQKCVRPGW